MVLDVKTKYHIKFSTILISLIVFLVLANVIFFGSVIRQSFTNVIDIIQDKDFEIIYESVVYDGINLNFSVKKNTETPDLTALKFVIENETGKYEYQQEVLSDFDILSFSINVLGKISEILKLSVFPIYKKATLEEEIGQGVVHFLDDNQQQGIISYPSEGDGAGSYGIVPDEVIIIIPNQTQTPPTPIPTSSTGKSLVGMNLAGVSYYDTQWVFVDVMKNAGAGGRWLTKNATGLSAWDTGYGLQIPLDSNGYPLEIPYNVPSVSTPQFVHILIKGTGNYPSGDYTVFYDGDGDLDFDLSSLIISKDTILKKYVVRVASPTTGGGLHIVIKRSNISDPIKNIRIITPGFENTYQTQTFHPLFLQRLQGVGAIRFMDFQKTNNNPSTTTRTPKTYFTQSHPNGVALEYQIELANVLDADPWFNIPHLADDNYIRQFAITVKQQLEPDKKVYIEYSNELWNTQFSQTTWIQQQGCNDPITKVTNAGGSCDSTKSGFKYQAKRSAEIFKIFEEEFGVDANRLVKVAGGRLDAGSVQTAHSNLLMGYFSELNISAPNALAITTYFGETIRNQALNQTYSALTVSEVLDKAEAHLYNYTKPNIQINKQIANNYGVKLIAYEGGQHIVAAFEFTNEANLVNKLLAANRDLRMEDLYNKMYLIWFQEGGNLLAHFNYAFKPDKFGSWGVLEYQDQPELDAPKYRATKNAINTYKDGSTIQPPSSVCGNGIKEGNEACDDGNTINGDGCSSLCITEIPTGCTSNSQCNDNNACTNDVCTSGTCLNTAITCNDNVACTTDSCNSLSGCVYTANNNLCNDNNACTTDVCGTIGCTNTPILGCGGGGGAPTAGLVLHLDFENGFNDVSGNGNSLTCSSIKCPVLSTGPDGSNAYSFDGIDDSLNKSVSNGQQLDLTGTSLEQPFSISVWIKPNTLSSSASAISTVVARDSFSLRTYRLSVKQNEVLFRTGNSTNPKVYSDKITSTNLIPIGSWTHIVVVFKGSSGQANSTIDSGNLIDYYINGNFNAGGGFNNDGASAGSTHIIVGSYGGSSSFFNGTVDDLRIYNKALLDSEVQSVYNSYTLISLSPEYNKNLFQYLADKINSWLSKF